VEWLYLLIGLGLIFLAAELFTNAIEWFGKRLDLSEGAVGSVLAAVGTALPETSVALVGVLMGAVASSSHKGIDPHTEAGIGAILGAPMMLSTLAMFITGLSVIAFASMKKRTNQISASYAVVGRDLRNFFLVYILALVAAIGPFRQARYLIAVLLLIIYVVYVYRTFKCPECGPKEEHMRPLHFHRSVRVPRLRRVVTQLVAGLALMIIGAEEFVRNVTAVAQSMGFSPLVLSLIITPIATELPEKFNSITWMRHKKDTLALGNITGAMVFQSSILPAVGMLFTPWILDEAAVVSIVVALLASAIIGVEMTVRKRLSPYSLLIGGVLYLLYPLWVFVISPVK
jgi:cation:H+ antiporter